MKKTETYWEVNFFDTKNKVLEDFYGNTENQNDIQILKEKAFKKGYDVVEVVEIKKVTETFIK